MTVVDLFAGCGGWDLGARQLGIDPIGIEVMPEAVATRHAAGLPTIRADLSAYRPARHLDGLIASPPCQDFSIAGSRAGRAGARGQLTDVVPIWVLASLPRWFVCEQVPPVLAIWEEHRRKYERIGYSVWTGILNAADYGVPQTRKRAILIARRDGIAALPPEPTHTERPMPSLFGPELSPWVSQADALGWGMTARPYPVIASGRTTDGPDREKVGGSGARKALYAERDAGRWVPKVLDRRFSLSQPEHKSTQRPIDEPAMTITASADNGAFRWVGQDGQAIVLDVRDALQLQTFPADYPLAGTKTAQFLQVGNAVPPLLARHVLQAATGRTTR